jgi:hypothetical protein
VDKLSDFAQLDANRGVAFGGLPNQRLRMQWRLTSAVPSAGAGSQLELNAEEQRGNAHADTLDPGFDLQGVLGR